MVPSSALRMWMDVNSHVWSALNNLAASGECCNRVKLVVNICFQFVVYARITFAPAPYNLFVYDFPYGFQAS